MVSKDITNQTQIDNRSKDTLCWTCKKSCNSTSCSWVKEFKPIPNWKAIPTTITQEKGLKDNSFIVQSCPEYEQESLSSNPTEIRDMLLKYFRISSDEFTRKSFYYIHRYEQETGTEIPLWYKYFVKDCRPILYLDDKDESGIYFTKEEYAELIKKAKKVRI